MLKHILFLITMFLITTPVYSASPNIKEGLWEVSSKIGVPGMNLPETKFNQCLKKENYVPTEPSTNKEKQNCKTYDISVKGNTVYWKFECKTDGITTKGKGEITYKGDTFEGKTTISQPGMEMTQIMKGKWIGPCPK
ncbi:MAG: DUF3617 domain-containing protein [Calditerrivibrio sp.]|nr:DUF3617 domain-containing protein [Calditerrivibrio sp.]